MTMRLNLDAVLRNQLPPVQQRRSRDDRKEEVMWQKPALRKGNEPVNRYFPDNGDVKQRVTSMMVNIHKHMKTTAPPRKAVPAIPAAIAELPPPPSLSQSNSTRRMRRIKGGGVSSLAMNKGKSISQVKARMNRQTQQVMRRGYMDMGPKNFANQRRIREVLLQKNVLENMLLQHKRLQRDRQTIALDIQRMRQDLDRIKTKLDTSLQTLNSTRNLYSGIAKSKNSLSGSLPSNVVSANTNVKSGSSGILKPKPKTSAIKQGIVSKRQHAAPFKRRVRS